MGKVIRLTESNLIKLVKKLINEIDQDQFTKKFNQPDVERPRSGELVKMVTPYRDGNITFNGILVNNEEGLPLFIPLENGLDIDQGIRDTFRIQGWDSLSKLNKQYNEWAITERKLEFTDLNNNMPDRDVTIFDPKNYYESGICLKGLHMWCNNNTKVVKY
jgi:hypothetical protein